MLMNRDFRKFKSSPIFPFYTPCTRRIKIQRKYGEVMSISNAILFFFLLIYFRAGTPTITVEGSGLDMDSISVVSSIAPSHIYQCKCPKHKSLIVVSYPYLHRRPPFISLSLFLSLFLYFFFLSFFLFPLNLLKNSFASLFSLLLSVSPLVY